jgi:hypothetical protein
VYKIHESIIKIWKVDLEFSFKIIIRSPESDFRFGGEIYLPFFFCVWEEERKMEEFEKLIEKQLESGGQNVQVITPVAPQPGEVLPEVINDPDIEQKWAMSAIMHSETYMSLISSIPDCRKLKLTRLVFYMWHATNFIVSMMRSTVNSEVLFLLWMCQT